ncbi:LysR family transcriptional regulator [Oceanobacillus damuensis]|uniref:LysR family transcriptional regulator n=1 Tax=Oceanobacillus damuensis TaxID=937928 RepID=UPI000835CB99|nr:LysR family transcriptional regulator [Oceanobacillus damuensis]
MNESQLQTFLTVVKYKSYSKAAAALHVTQPTVTSRIKALEDILQCELFERIGHEIFLTKEGNMLVEYAKNILIYIKHSKEIPNLVKDPVIKVGFSPGYAYSFIVEVLKTIKEIGDIDIQILEGYDSVDLNERALSGEVDLIFTRNVLSNNQDIVSEYLFDNHIVLVLPKNHHLNQKKPIHLEDLHGQTVISYRRNSALWRLIDQQLMGVQNITRIDVENNEMLVQAAQNDIGIGITPELGIDKRYNDEVEIRKITEIYNIPNQVYVQYRKSSQIRDLAKKITYSIISHKYG